MLNVSSSWPNRISVLRNKLSGVLPWKMLNPAADVNYRQTMATKMCFCILLLSVPTLRAFSISHDQGTPCPKNCSCITEHTLQVECRSLNLTHVPTSPELKLFKEMDLSSNYFKTIRADFFEDFSNLSILTMKSCKTETIDVGAFHSLKNLETIDVSDNYLADIPPELFIQNQRLKNVSLSDNPLTSLQHGGPILVSSSILHLHIRSCMLSKLSNTSLSRLPNLQSLDLSGNGLKVLSTDTLLPLLNLIDINLDGNDWTCNDDFEKLVCLAYRKSNSQTRSLTCATKKGFKKVYNLRDQCELCGDLSTIKPSGSSITSTPKELVDVATDMTVRTSVALLQNISQEHTTATLQDDVHTRNNENNKAFTQSTPTDSPRPNYNNGLENSENDASGTQITPWVVESKVTSERELRSEVTSDTELRSEVTSEREIRTAPKRETDDESWNVINVLMVLVILPITLCVAVFVSLIAVHYVKKGCNDNRTQRLIQEEAGLVTASSHVAVPLLNTPLICCFTRKGRGYGKRGSDVSGTEENVYEEVY